MARVGRLVKETIVGEVAAQLSDRPEFFIASINRLRADETDAFRLKLSGAKARLMMVSRRLCRRAIEPMKLSGLTDLLEGSVGFIFTGDDVVTTAKIIAEFRRTHEEQLLIRGALIEGQLLSPDGVAQLASLPSRPVLLAHLVAALESPMADVIFTIERALGDVIWLTEQAAATKPTSAPTEEEQSNG